MPKRAIHIFRRDLRLHDNTSLIQASADADEVLPIFVFNPKQIKNNPYAGDNSLSMLHEGVEDLKEQLTSRGGQLFTFYGDVLDIVKDLHAKIGFDAVYINKDYTPFSLKRDTALQKLCNELGIAFTSCDDALLQAPGTVLKDDGTYYTIFTPFFKRARSNVIPKPQELRGTTWYTKAMQDADHTLTQHRSLHPSPQRTIVGGRSEALKALTTISHHKNYKSERDIPSVKGTTHLSTHHKFGTISVRETYHAVSEALGEGHEINRQLYWRDFFTHIAFSTPRVFGEAFQKKYKDVVWDNNEDKWEAWKQGKTGFPIVDAGMRELRESGYMHNRTRMIVASFLVKDLHIDWQKGEQFFAQYLVDYDPAVNNGSWQWAASTGCDAQPYFRIFNPWLQQKRFDPDCSYIKRWLPELKDLSAQEIHKLGEQRPLSPIQYPKPIVDHRTESEVAKSRFKYAG